MAGIPPGKVPFAEEIIVGPRTSEERLETLWNETLKVLKALIELILWGRWRTIRWVENRTGCRSATDDKGS